MLGRLLGLLVFFSMIFGFEYLCYTNLEGFFNSSTSFYWIYGISTIVFIVGFFNVITQFRTTKRTLGFNLLIGLALNIFVSKLFIAVGFIIYDILRLIAGFVIWLLSMVSGDQLAFIPARGEVGNWVVIGLGIFAFLSMLYGITGGKYRYTVNKIKVKINGLPKAFQGFKIAQISDIHAGTFDSITQVEKGVQMLNDQNTDLFVFTGDLINFHKDEIDPYIQTFAKIKAPFGTYSILGNHDYYGIQNVAKSEKGNYFNEFAKKHAQIGFELLRNENVSINKDGESINLIGVENWGVGGFPKTGDLDKALVGINKSAPNILLSHDPSHWDHKVLEHPVKVDLTLSGHTHGMQFGINIGKFKWSPVQYRYKRWMGLYEENDRQLYVNRGFGFLGFPGRVFMWPEITVFELQPA